MDRVDRIDHRVRTCQVRMTRQRVSRLPVHKESNLFHIRQIRMDGRDHGPQRQVLRSNAGGMSIRKLLRQVHNR